VVLAEKLTNFIERHITRKSLDHACNAILDIGCRCLVSAKQCQFFKPRFVGQCFFFTSGVKCPNMQNDCVHLTEILPVLVCLSAF